MSDLFDLHEDMEYVSRSLHARLSTPILRRLMGTPLFLPEGLAIQRLAPGEEPVYYPSLTGLQDKELVIYAAVTSQRRRALVVRLEDGTPLIDPTRLRKY